MKVPESAAQEIEPVVGSWNTVAINIGGSFETFHTANSPKTGNNPVILPLFFR